MLAFTPVTEIEICTYCVEGGADGLGEGVATPLPAPLALGVGEEPAVAVEVGEEAGVGVVDDEGETGLGEVEEDGGPPDGVCEGEEGPGGVAVALSVAAPLEEVVLVDV